MHYFIGLVLFVIAAHVQAHDPISDLTASINRLVDSGSRPTTDNSEEVALLREKIEAVEANIAALPATAQAADLAEIKQQITANKAAIEAKGGGINRTTAVAPIRLDGLENNSLIPSSPMMKQVNMIDVEFTIESFVDNQSMVLLSRDESGQDDPGHFSLFVAADRRIELRSQGIKDGGNNFSIKGQKQLEAGTPHRVIVILGPTRTVLFLDGIEVGSSDIVNSWSGNDLPLIIGATCWALKRAECLVSDKRTNTFNGTVSADLYAARQVFVIQ